jgi:hypothetical protein
MDIRNKFLTFASAGVFGFGMLNIAHAQGLPPDDGGGFEIGIEEPAEEEGLFENLSQYFGATAGANNGSADNVEKSMQAISVTVDLPAFSGVKTAVSFDVGNYENIYKLELREEDQQVLQQCESQYPNPNDPAIDQIAFTQAGCDRVQDDDGNYLSPTQERTVDDSFTELTEGYIQWEPTSFATLRVGRQPIVLGQFEVFSPLMFTVPMKATGTKTKTNKADMSYAQDGLQVSLFPLPQMEVSFTNIPKMRLDPSNQKRFEEFALLRGDFTNFLPGEDQVEILQDIGENDMNVARIMYFGDRFTFGVSSIQGAETNEDPLREARLTQVPCQNYFPNNTPEQYSECNGWNGGIDQSVPANVPGTPQANVGTFQQVALGDDKGLRFAEIDVIAFELAVRLTSKLTFIVEQTVVEGEKEFEILPSGAEQGSRPRAFGRNVGSGDNVFDGTTNLLPTFEQLIAQNSGKPYYNSEVTMQSAGFVYKGERWLINAQLAQRTEEAATAQEEAWKDVLSWETYEGDDEGGDDDILPILNAVRLLGAEKQGYAGFGFGSFGQSFGFGLSAGWRFFEKLEIGAFGGMALDVTGADEIEAEGYESVECDTYASFGINYLF